MAPHALRVMVCARLPDSTLSKKISDASWGALKDLFACGIISAVLPFSTTLTLWPGANECISPTAILNDLLFKIVVRSDRLCILVSGLLDACVTAFNLRRTHRGIGLNFKELVHGRIKDDNCPVSGVGPHVSVDVFGF